MQIFVYFGLFFLFSASRVSCADEADFVATLPGADGTLKYKQYSGYLNGSDDGNLQLHYWFVESQGNPDTDPLVLWLNGGPGCSSLDGMLYEHGPQLVNEDGQTLSANQYAWNYYANMIYLESPVCVGFSYARDGNCTTDDDVVSLQNYNALLHFYEKFPEFSQRDLYITGESYGGIYVPTLTYRIYESGSKLADNLAGFAIGNGELSVSNNSNSMIAFAYSHGIISQDFWDDLRAKCCNDDTYPCDFASSTSVVCQALYYKAYYRVATTKALNIYDVEGFCYLGPDTPINSGDIVKARMGWDMLLRPVREAGHAHMFPEASQDVPCVDSVGATIYLNSAEVREALHISPAAPAWQICNLPLNVHFGRIYQTMHPQFETLISGGVRSLIYHGDVDAACNFLGGQLFVDQLGLKKKDDLHAWYVDGQIGGWWSNYDDILQFTTVKGAGHTVPQYTPAAAQVMFKAFINNNYK